MTTYMPLSNVINQATDAWLLVATIVLLLLLLKALTWAVTRTGYLVAAFFGGVHQVNHDDPVTGYADPGAPRRGR